MGEQMNNGRTNEYLKRGTLEYRQSSTCDGHLATVKSYKSRKIYLESDVKVLMAAPPPPMVTWSHCGHLVTGPH